MMNSKSIYVRPEMDVCEVSTNGMLCASDQITGPGYEGVSLFLPAAGYLDGGSPVSVGESGKYWYSNYYYGNSFGSRTYKFNYLNLNSFEKTHTYFGQGGYNHYFSIRPVMVQ